jgi:hypothetical protein
MERLEIIAVLNRHVFDEERAYLIKNIAENPYRFVGIFRSTPPKLKLIQNILQSREIRFGDALEEIIENLLKNMGYKMLEKAATCDKGTMSFDQYFTVPDNSRYYLVEQKVRDDHDSSKKTGQVDNFKKKLSYLKTIHGAALTGIMYFIDPAFEKNRAYYTKEINSLSKELGIPVCLFYNGEIFEYLGDSTSAWQTLNDALMQWRSTVPQEINLDFDAEPERTILETQSVPALIWHRLAVSDPLWDHSVVQSVFPTGVTLERLSDRWVQRGDETFIVNRRRTTFCELAALLRQRLHRHYGDRFAPPPPVRRSLFW